MPLFATRWALSLPGLCHLLFLAAVAGYVVIAYPGSDLVAILILAASAVAECAPASWKHRLFGELVLLIGAAIGLIGFAWPGEPGFQGWMRLVLTAWLLVPSRPGLLRWLLSLTIAELLVLGTRSPSPWAAAALAPLGLASLAVDAWLRGAAAGSARHQAHHGSWQALAHWTALPVAVAVAVAVAAGPIALRLAESARIARIAHDGRKSGLSLSIDIGSHRWVDRDPHVAARLVWDIGSLPLLSGMQYLRAISLSDMRVEGPRVVWDPSSAHSRPLPQPVIPRNARIIYVLRQPSIDDVVLRPDDGGPVDLDQMRADRAGNLFRPGIGESIRAYPASLDPSEDPDDDADIPFCRALPPELAALPWDRIEEGGWSFLDGESAAEAIVRRLDQRCTYAIDDLPLPQGGPAATLRTFLFGAPGERRGHCQYFATACAVLLRHAGHPARCVVGFASDEHDDEGYVFRGLHAHAWVEVHSAGAWHRVDPTPAGERARQRGAGFDPDDPAAKVPPRPPLLPKPIDQSIAATDGDGRWWVIAGIALLVTGVAAMTALATAAHARRRSFTPAQAAARRQVEDLLRLAANLGIPVGPDTTLSDLAARLEDRTGIPLDAYLGVHLAARYGAGPPPLPWPLAELRATARGKGLGVGG